MFLRCKVRRKDGKQHRYWSVVENTRTARGRVVQRHVLYLGEINDTQELAWRRSIEVLEEGATQPRTLSLFPEDRFAGALADASIVHVKLSQLQLRRPRQWGACWLALMLWRELQLDQFWSKRLGSSRKGTHWDQVLFVLVAYRLLAPGSEWRLHREWFRRSALADLLGDDAGLAEIHKLYRCHDRLLQHKQAVFDHLTGRWRDLFNISYDVLLYDLTSTYFEADPPFPEGDKRRFGYSRDHRPDCVQIVIALVVTPEGLPLALTRLEKHLVARPWQEARPGVQVKLLAQEGELYVLAQSRDRVAKERAMRRRQLKRLWARLKQLSTMQLTREELLMKLGAARDQSRIAWRLAVIEVATDSATFSYRLDRDKLRQARSREGRYLLRTNLVEEDPAKLWSHYLLLVAVEEAFKNLKGDLAIRPVFHQLEARVEAHVFIAFLAYCVHVTLARRLHALAPGLTPRSVLEKFAAMQMIDVHLPTTDGRELVLTRYTEPELELSLLLAKLKLELPVQPPPKITAGPVPPIPL
jgi:hypothetical protein